MISLNLRSRLNGFRERLRFRYGGALAQLIITRSSRRAETVLGARPRVRILVDVTIFQHAVTHETAWISTGEARFGSDIRGTGYAARVPVHSAETDARVYENVCYLAGIAELYRRGTIDLFTSAELEDEKANQPAGRYRGYSYFDFTVFNFTLPSIDDDLRVGFGCFGPGMPSSKDQRRKRFSQYADAYPEYAAMVGALGQRNSQDTWHIFTADRYDLTYFLTMDFSFIANMEAQQGNRSVKKLNVKVISPADFGKISKLKPVAPHLLSYVNASFFVRSDTAMPGGKRRPLNAYQRSSTKRTSKN